VSKTKPAPPKKQTEPTLKRTVQRAIAHRAWVLERKYQRELEAEQRREKAQADAAPRAARLDVAGIRQGLLGGSAANTKGGAGGKALTAEQHSLFDAYWAMFRERWKENHVPPANVSDRLQVRIEFYLAGNGSISRARVLNSSGNAEFDRSVLEALGRVRMPPPPDGRGDTHDILFKMRDEESE
jgi:colicin import membrane protein